MTNEHTNSRQMTSPAPDLSFYQSMYNRLYRFGYHKDPNYSHAKRVCDYLVRTYEFESVLDIGCAMGWSVNYFAEHGKEAKGIDVSEIAAQKATQLGREVHCGSATSIPFEDKCFDVVMSTDCYEHLRPDDVDTAIKEAFRVSRKYLCFTIATERDHNRLWRLIAGKPLHLTIMSLDEWIERFLAQGGKLIFRYDITFVVDISGSTAQ